MRTENSIKNSVIGILGQVFNIILNFVSRTIFIFILGANYLGVNGLFTNILSILSLAELGIGSAIIYHMYKPLANKDEEKLKSLMHLYAKAYRYIGLVVAIVGLSIVPFLGTIIKDKPNVEHLTIIYLLFLANSVISYFFAYKTSIITADQKSYIISIKQQEYLMAQIIIQSVILLLTKNYMLYLSIQMICTFLLNLSISKKANLLYPFLKSKDVRPLGRENKKIIFKHVTAMMSHKVGAVVVNGTDNILISSFVGVYWVGLYSNYVMIITMLTKIIGQIFTAITASIGNLNAQENKEKSYDIYKKVFFVNFWIFGFCSICLIVLFNPFIELWVGSNYIMSTNIVLVIVINFYMGGMRQATTTYNSTLGLFWNNRFKPWVEAIINLVASIFLLRRFGIVGVFLGTFISTVATSLWVDSYVLYKHGFNEKLSKYFSKYFRYTFITIIAAGATQYISSLFVENTYLNFIFRLIDCLVVPNIVFVLGCFKMKEFDYAKNLILSIMTRKIEVSR
ncbi:lipopolysaccharide biosynthesis protein [Clostridium beijerinckii]|uniref:lipopolysaccharide biosynthesis protein n=1 Tax=Clostridium beijerinckii TaxID=1520 RepID=UPI00156E4FB8|nr:oligosaccharide flippase family protein [Clostridium beijerinckii]NRT70225.1 O-antigen/teichoic acid export membrane protein [Clostridium beijerinckii]